ncbi:phosphoadenylyl-sulfate reductase [Tateyamaria pelophila]|uniref:phosphoadenylyl-sulfate reductase n=1 Tax=Tateyamaria pelophila TaxID=328415 RepID=UPI001CC1AD84|nr:phosphoadenylyl-sulfate reductase [Tateyamaria pelophila]
MLHLAQKTLPEGSASHAADTLVAALNARLQHHGATDVLREALAAIPDLALVSSFGAESVVLLHLGAMIKRDIPVIFIDTEMLFAETLVYQMEVAERLRLQNVTVIRAENTKTHDPDSTLHLRDTDACCALRKTVPLQNALKPHAGWITGRKRYQSDSRAGLDFFEVEDGTSKIKVNPLARWAAQDICDYMDENRLPRHPLVAQGYPSIGCAPCTSRVASGEDPRAGRWRDQDKEECGIHFVDGKLVRAGTVQNDLRAGTPQDDARTGATT